MSALPVARGNASLPQDIAYLEKRDAMRNMQRYYRVSVAPTLFGDWAMVREWGRIGQRGGSRMECCFASEEEARRFAQAMTNAKLRRGYRSFSTNIL